MSAQAEKFTKNWMITDIHRGKASQGRDHILYAKLINAQGELEISATLDYVLERVKQMTAAKAR